MDWNPWNGTIETCLFFFFLFFSILPWAFCDRHRKQTLWIMPFNVMAYYRDMLHNIRLSFYNGFSAQSPGWILNQNKLFLFGENTGSTVHVKLCLFSQLLFLPQAYVLSEPRTINNSLRGHFSWGFSSPDFSCFHKYISDFF